jgi:hypothetical protein
LRVLGEWNTPMDMTAWDRARHDRGLGDYPSGADAPLEATARALAMSTGARSVILVEGISDQVAVEAAADVLGRDLSNDGVVIVPIGGAHAMTKYLIEFGPRGRDLTIAGLCDQGEEGALRAAVALAGVGSPMDRPELERLGFFVCVEDLESELIETLGPERVEEAFEANGDLGRFRSLQRQPEWRGQPVEEQMRRFLGSGSRRKLRYADILVGEMSPEEIPFPIQGVLAVSR